MNKNSINFAEQVALWKASGKSMAAYCKKQELYYQMFTYHAL